MVSAQTSPQVRNGLVDLQRSDLHAALSDPVLDSVNFLNEVIDRYPQAISFAPGAPNPTSFDSLDIHRYLARYEQHLADEHGLTSSQVHRRLYQYGPSRGQINSLVADGLRRDYGIDVVPQSIVVTVGCQEAMLLALRALRATRGDKLAVVNPCYVGVIGAARMLDMELVSINEGTEGVDLAELENACKTARAQNTRIRAVYVAPDFSNPGGTLMSLRTRQALLTLAAQQDFLVFEDSTYGFTTPDDMVLPALKQLDNERRVVYFGTFAKICLPGTRVGFVVADQTISTATGQPGLLADELATLKTMVTVNTSPICQAIIGGMLLEHGGSLAAFARDRGELYRKNLRLLLEKLDIYVGQLDGISWNRPQGGFFVRVKVPVVADEELVRTCARDFGVLWMPMEQFYVEGKACRELRLSCSYLTPDQIDDGIKRLAVFLRMLSQDSPSKLT